MIRNREETKYLSSYVVVHACAILCVNCKLPAWFGNLKILVTYIDGFREMRNEADTVDDAVKPKVEVLHNAGCWKMQRAATS